MSCNIYMATSFRQKLEHDSATAVNQCIDRSDKFGQYSKTCT